MKIFPSFPSFRFQYKGQNQKLVNLANFQLPQTKHILWDLKVLKIFPSFPSFWYQCKGQNRNLGNFLLPQIKHILWNLQVLKIFPSFPSFRFQYNGQNRKLGKFGNFQLPQIKKILKIYNSETPEVLNFIAVKKTDGAFEYSLIFQVCLVKAHQCINTFL